MIINHENLKSMDLGFRAAFQKTFEGGESQYAEIAMVTQSTTLEEVYPWLGEIPRMREWVGSRIVNNLKASGFTIKNRDFESTIVVDRNSIEDDRYGVYGPLFEELGREAREQPDRLVFELLANGFTERCYDGTNFFAEDHPVIDASGAPFTISNVQAGTGPAWYLLDTSRAVRPIIYQKRRDYGITSLLQESDPNVFWRNEYVYGVSGRSNAGFGLWQLAVASKAPLTSDNYELARAAMTSLRGDTGRLLGITPTILVVPMTLEGAGRRVLNTQTKASGASNEWAGSAKLIATPWTA